MTGTKKKLSDILKKAKEKKETVKPTTPPVSSTTPKTGVTSTAKKSLDDFKKARGTATASTTTGGKTLEDFKKARGLDTRAKQAEILKTKTHQDLINAVYKVADELKSEGGPWPMLRAAGWGNFTDDRGALYKGPIIDDLEKLTDEQKAALKKQLGI